MYRRWSPQLFQLPLRWLHGQHEVKGGQQEVIPIRFDYQCVHGLESIIGEVRVLSKHHDGDLWVDLLHLSRDDRTVQEAQGVLHHNCVHVPRHEKLKAFVAVGRGYEIVPVLSQQTELGRLPVNAEYSVVASHSG